MDTTKKILESARDKVVGGWVQREMAIDKRGNNVLPHDHDAVCFCSLGAIEASAGRMNYLYRTEKVEEPKRILAHAIYGDVIPGDYIDAIIDWNDESGRTKNDVIEMFERAIEII